LQEAVALPDKQIQFINETGIDFSFMFALLGGTNGGEARPEDSEWYASQLGDPPFPVFVDIGDETLADATPLSGIAYPELCVLSPAMEILACYSGHDRIDMGLDDIQNHANTP
jgi:hypothetical protein